jgi:predicted phosphodiesterase
MPLAVISDIHGNLEALQAVLADLDGAGITSAVSLGDNVGYGPDPEEVVELLKMRGIPSLMGNHEMALADARLLAWFNPQAAENLQQTRALLSPQTKDFLAGLPFYSAQGPCRFVHGCPPDSATTYLFELSDHDLKNRLAQLPEKISFVGHTHHLGLIRLGQDGISHHALEEGSLALEAASRYLVNVGSVGQPRDGDPRAKYVIFMDDPPSLEVRFVPYDAKTTADKIIKRGFANYYADRLRQGA